MTQLEKTQELLTELGIVFSVERDTHTTTLVIEADTGPKNQGFHRHGTSLFFSCIGSFLYICSWEDD